MQWAFFVDANLEPEVATLLDKEGYCAEYSDYVLGEDADDEDDILPYVRQEELVVITADVKNFAAFDESHHEGVFYLDNQRTSAYRIANAVLDIINQYGSPDHMNGKTENIDKWITK
jgi:predicted nuclease of predicted toxin-antitoxin system